VDLTPCREAESPERALSRTGFFCFGQRIASVSTNDAGFGERFLRLFADCLAPAPGAADAAPVALRVIDPPSGGSAIAECSEHGDEVDPTVLDLLFPEARFTVAACAALPGWQLYACARAASQPVIATRGGRIVIDKGLPWQMIAGHYFVHHVLRLQPAMAFLHGASVAIGERGVLLGGAKGAGKSTLSLALAARGHGFLGDEVAALHPASRRLLAFRRAASIRDGPQAQRVAAYVGAAAPERETAPDGTLRTRLRVSTAFPQASAREVGFTDAFFLDGFGAAAAAQRFEFSTGQLHRLGSLRATFDRRPAGGRAVELLNLFAGVRCYMLTVGGSPDETADLIERTVEGDWATAFRKKPSTSERFAG
jgi:hypothetical protein